MTLYTQEDPVAVNLPLAPTAASIAKYGDVPVSESTGIPSIGVPVTSLNHRGLGINVSLSYHAGGVRVSDEASWVGLGWSISGGGMITRAIRGHDDFAPRSPTPASRQPVLGYIDALQANKVPFAPELDDWVGGSDGIRYQGNYRFSRFTGPGNVNTFTNYCDADNSNYVDMQSDLYSFNFPEGSGKFFINKNGEPQLVDATDMTIAFVRHNGAVNWIITTGAGYSYHFGGDRELTQYTSNYTSSTGGQNTPLVYKYMSAWYIDKIVTPQGGVVA